jgi:hypothetical protein
MRSYVFILLPIFILFFLCTACSNEWEGIGTIQQFQDAVNATDFNSFKDTLSEDSIFWFGDPTTQIQGFLDTFIGFTPVFYSEFEITENSNDATVLCNATYKGIPVNVKFIMRKHSGVWKIREYWDDNNLNDQLEFIWHKIGKSIPL